MKFQTLNARITTLCVLLVGSTIVLGAVALTRITYIGELVNIVKTDSLPGVYSAGRIEGLSKSLRLLILTHIAESDVAAMDRIEQELAATEAELRRMIAAYEKTATTASERELLDRVSPAVDNWLRVWPRIRPLSRAAQAKEVLEIVSAECSPAFARVIKATDDLRDYSRTTGEKNAGTMEAAASAARAWLVVLLIASAVLASGIAFWMTRSMNRILRKAVDDIASGAEQVASGAAQVSASSQSLSESASEQAAGAEETSAATEELTAITQKNADTCRTAAELAQGVSAAIEEGDMTLEQMVESMQSIQTSSDKISKIIKVIDEIAFQTNILALNAAVEAARAGEAGMGFAVVAEEVRNLAQRCSQAAKDTEALIGESVANAREGNVRLEEVGGVFRKITESARRVSSLVAEVNTASQEQAKGIQQVAQAVVQIQSVTQQVAASAEESAAASEELTTLSESLRDSIGTVQTLAGGTNRAAARRGRRVPACA